MTRLPKCAVGMAALLLGQALLSKADISQPRSGTWAATGGPMTEARTGASAALLPDGRVLIAGGTGADGPLATAELYDSSGFFTATTPMQQARASHACAALQDGRVLVAGGVSTGGVATSSAEVYDPATAAWSLVGDMAQARSAATATLLKDGRVLIAGGHTSLGVSPSLEIFDPASNVFTAAGRLSSPRKGHAAALLPDGRVLIAGGTSGPVALTSTEIYDPSTGVVSPGPSLSTARVGLSATALLDGKVLVAGGNNGTAGLDSAEVYDPAVGTFSPTAGRLATARRDHLALLLPLNNNVLIVGGMSGNGFAQGAELFAPWNGTFTSTGAPATPREGAVASTLQIERQILAAGGAQSSAELYGFATIKTDKPDYGPGETVVITGSGWEPLETVCLLLQEQPKVDADRSLKAVADQDGNIRNEEFQTDEHDAGVTFHLTASGAASQAQTTFTDDAACGGEPD